ncbi:MAG: kinase [Marinobacter sp.]|uniref:kinase n=1 Tax=Marinobacter sp. TaxID=50741 RepID=UPI00299D37ED|nr:kinase [Marinobacter sp.]MDX1635374.1 kinase [Marinobacter sp.]
MSQPEARYTVRALLLTAVLTIIVTVVALQLSGRIDHSGGQLGEPVGEFTAVHLTPNEEFRMSAKNSELHAVCRNGYLGVASNVDPDFFGVLVDYRNRGVRCGPAINATERRSPAPTAPADDAPSQ